jgi:hypothetical protein
MQLLTNGIFTSQQEEQMLHFIRLKGYMPVLLHPFRGNLMAM